MGRGRVGRGDLHEGDAFLDGVLRVHAVLEECADDVVLGLELFGSRLESFVHGHGRESEAR